MLARSRELQLRNGVALQTPALIPSISSKGFPPVLLDGAEVPAAAFYMEAFARWATESLLVSAYDIHHGLIAGTDALFHDFKESLYAKPRLLVIDSGLYEFRPSSDAGEIYVSGEKPQEWTPAMLGDTIDGLPAEASAAVVNWDSSDEYANQIEAGFVFFNRGDRARFASIFLLKPEPGRDFHDFSALERNADQLAAFDIVGVTEKELGDSIADRLHALARLRQLLDRVGGRRPIHVFGGLDPLLTPLYFAAGAEVFDGLSWLRYIYADGISLYREAAVVLEGALAERLPRAVMRLQIRNLQSLADLQHDLRLYATTGRWTHFRQAATFDRAAKVLGKEATQ